MGLFEQSMLTVCGEIGVTLQFTPLWLGASEGDGSVPVCRLETLPCTVFLVSTAIKLAWGCL